MDFREFEMGFFHTHCRLASLLGFSPVRHGFAFPLQQGFLLEGVFYDSGNLVLRIYRKLNVFNNKSYDAAKSGNAGFSLAVT